MYMPEHSSTSWNIKSVPANLSALFFSPAKGIFFYSPTILIAITGIKKMWKKHKRFTVSALILACSYSFVISANFAWHGSLWSMGPRYVLPVVAILYIPIIECTLGKRFKYIIIIGLMLQLLLMSVNYKRNILQDYMNGKLDNKTQYVWNPMNIPYLSQ